VSSYSAEVRVKHEKAGYAGLDRYEVEGTKPQVEQTIQMLRQSGTGSFGIMFRPLEQLDGDRWIARGVHHLGTD